MSIRLCLEALGVLVGGGILALLAGRSPRVSSAVGSSSAVIGSVLGLFAAADVLRSGVTGRMSVPWNVPYGSFTLEIDALAAWFLLPVFGLSALAAVYGHEYLMAWRERRSLGPPWFFFNLLVAGMAMVIVSANAVLFLVAWEVMALASYFLVTFESDQEAVREAGWTYLVATHLGTAFLLAMFCLLGGGKDSLDFDRFGPASGGVREGAGAIFLLALIGFGTKAGFVPMHVWLPDAHPAAPSHVSAVMSGVMIKTGIYGLVRTLGFLGAPAPWWGWTLIGIGLLSGLVGILFALGQRDLKRLLAYSSVENVGIIAMGLGLSLVGRAAGSVPIALLGMAGALLHVLNHALFKGMLFLGAGAVLHATGTREMDRLGGLWRTMPWTGAAFAVGATAIAGLPPLNGFAGEFLIYLGAFSAAATAAPESAAPALAIIGGLALVGGLAAACFAQAFGLIFLGSPRSEAAAHAHPTAPAMRILAGVVESTMARLRLLRIPQLLVGAGSPSSSSALDPSPPWPSCCS